MRASPERRKLPASLKRSAGAKPEKMTSVNKAEAAPLQFSPRGGEQRSISGESMLILWSTHSKGSGGVRGRGLNTDRTADEDQRLPASHLPLRLTLGVQQAGDGRRGLRRKRGGQLKLNECANPKSREPLAVFSQPKRTNVSFSTCQVAEFPAATGAPPPPPPVRLGWQPCDATHTVFWGEA